MLATAARMRKHLRRLERVWVDWPIYFITTCTLDRRRIFASTEIAGILTDEWRNARNHHGWAIGRYVIMPEHVTFLLQSRVRCQSSADLYAKMERMER